MLHASSALCKGGAVASPTPAMVPVAAPSLPQPSFIDTSLDKFNVLPEIPIQQPVEVIPPQP